MLYRAAATLLLISYLFATPASADDSEVKKFRAEKKAIVDNEYVSRTTGMKFALIPAGDFLMGTSDEDVAAALLANPGLNEQFYSAERPQHRVRVTTQFYLGKFEVTQAEFEKVEGRNPSWFSATGKGKDKVIGVNTARFPVESVTWFDAVSFCNALSTADGLTQYYGLTVVARDAETQSITAAEVSIRGGTGYRLPTEVEWEYSCRAGTQTQFHFGPTLNGDKANVLGIDPFGTKTKGVFLGRTTAVDDSNYPLNTFGLSQMHGNAQEWCWDQFDKTVHGQGGKLESPDSGNRRALRGGNWALGAMHARSSNRGWSASDIQRSICGFRVASDLPPEKPAKKPRATRKKAEE